MTKWSQKIEMISVRRDLGIFSSIIQLNFNMSSTQAILIDNMVVSRTAHGGRVSTPIGLFKKLYRVDVDALPVVTLGDRRLDNLLILKFMTGKEIQFEELLTDKPRTLRYPSCLASLL